jgi:DNA replication initiation complex subunit (GINS family)
MFTIQDLIEIFTNEKSCKSLLPFENQIVNYFYNKLEEHRENLSQMKEDNIIKSIVELDIDRVEYMIKEYLLCRLNKLKKNFFIDMTLLSEGEKVFYSKYKKIFEEEDILDKDITSIPHENEVVGFICKDKSINIILDGEHLDIFQGDFFVTNIKNVFHLIKHKNIRFI